MFVLFNGRIFLIQGILERARERQRKLLEYNTEDKHTPLREANENPPDTSSPLHENSPVDVLKQSVSEGNLNSKLVKQNSLTRISSEITGSPNKQSNVLNIQKDNFNMEIKLSSVDNVRVQVEFQESDEFGTEEKENYEMCLEKEDDESSGSVPALRENSKKRLQRLGALYAGGDDANISSPIHRTEANFAMDSPSACSKIKNVTDSNRDLSKGNHKGLGGLATLAKTINQWEDNLSKVGSKIESFLNNRSIIVTNMFSFCVHISFI